MTSNQSRAAYEACGCMLTAIAVEGCNGLSECLALSEGRMN